MNPIDPAKLNVSQRLQASALGPVAASTPVRPIGGTASRPAESTLVATDPQMKAGLAAPIDTDRVSEIEKAVAEGRYPIIPTKIADAMIAAGFLLRTPE